MNSDLLRKITIAGTLTILAVITAGSILYLTQQTTEEEELSNWDNSGPKHPVCINDTEGLPMVDSGKVDQEGNVISVRCNTCHDNKDSNKTRKSGNDLNKFHQNLEFHHGSLSCVSCHNPENYETLRLADGQSLEFSETIQLCAQCHGPQYRDYRNGSHGGMNGYWDLNRGPRQRNTCTDCHAAHSPSYPKVMPVFPPKVRAGSKLPTSH